MHCLRGLALLAVLPAVVRAGDVALRTTPLLETPFYDRAEVEREVLRRIRAGVYDGYPAGLCIENPAGCTADVFNPYKTDSGYVLVIHRDRWDGLPAEVRDAAVREIVYFVWGHPNRVHSPVDVAIDGDPVGASPLAHLSPASASAYLRFAGPEVLVGARGIDSYGPNCWFHAIAAIADGRSAYARARLLAPAVWEKPRFMGPTEFRLHLRQFTQVTSPQFGDVIRYYTDDPIYGGYQGMVFGGEVHAAVYVGRETSIVNGRTASREIALTKNGRTELDFLMFQDVRGLDEAYLPPPGGDAAVPAGQRIKKGYFRVNRGGALLDPAATGRRSAAHGGHLVDTKNYADRWLCLAKLIDPPAGEGKNCYSYPDAWMTLPTAAPGAVVEARPGKGRRSPPVPPVGPPLRLGAHRAKADG